MHRPFWKITNNKKIIDYLKNIISSSEELGIKLLIIPLVDKGSIENTKQAKKLLYICKMLEDNLKKNKVKIIFESDFKPKKLANFIKKFDTRYFGINYDTGNSLL